MLNRRSWGAQRWLRCGLRAGVAGVGLLVSAVAIGHELRGGASLEAREGGDVVVLDPLDWIFGDDTYDLLLEQAVDLPEVLAGAVPMVPDREGVLRPLSDFEPRPTPVPLKDGYPKPGGSDADPREGGDAPRLKGTSTMPIVHPSRSDGFLSGRAVYVSQCHGWHYAASAFRPQRPNLFSTVEDFHNPEGANQFLIPMLENAGAMVYTARERDQNPRMAIADNDGSGYAEVGGGFEDAGWGFADREAFPYGENPFRAGTARRFPADGGGRAVWEPEVPAAGHYAVYVAWKSGQDHARDAHYRITHPGGVIDRRFDQTVHGSTWQYVETLYLTEGASLTVELIADSADSGRYLVADAVRIGGGMEQVQRAGRTTGLARWDSAAVLYTQYNGAPTSVYDPTGNGNGTDHQSRSRWARWEWPAGEDAVYLSWHSNAANGSARGTITYYAGGGPDAPASHSPSCSSGGAVQGSYTLSNLVQTELISVIRQNWAASWQDRGIGRACFSEVSPTMNNAMPSTLVELAFHDNLQDAGFLKRPGFRRDASRAMYRGIVRYFAERDGLQPHFLPEPPANLSLVHDDDGELRLSWEPGPVGAPYGDAPDAYLVELSADGLIWTDAFSVSAPPGGGYVETTLPVPPGWTRYARVVAENRGGLSFPSEVIGARRSPDGRAPVLVVSAFTRLDEWQLLNRELPLIGDVVHMEVRQMNPFDTTVAHGEAVRDLGWYFDTVSEAVFPYMDLSDYDLIWWVAGEESTFDRSIDTPHQLALRGFVGGGGQLIVTGSEVLWDLDFRGSPEDKAFAAEVLGALLVSDGAQTSQVVGEGVLADAPLMDFAFESGAPYPAEWPDTLAPQPGREVIARYTSDEVACVMGSGVVHCGFPFETVVSRQARSAFAAKLLPQMVPDYVPPVAEDDFGPGVEPDDPDDEAPISDRERRRLGGDGCGCASGGAGGLGGLMGLLGLFGFAASRRRNA